MINWNKPIETIDGHPARLVEANIETGRIIVYTYSGSGDVFLVNEEGYRCDDRASVSEQQEPVIRNVRIKREGWVHVRRGTRLLGDYRIFSTETDARNAASFSDQVVHMEWEE